MNWTTTWPTEVGWYWMYDPAYDETIPVRVPKAGVWIYGGGGGCMARCYWPHDIYWLPLAQPEPPTTTDEEG
tara:strand:- start:2079 stop:2294 length:216 start_codon:yes stop_codon:yes gene_type:complete